ncbi:MAG: methyltransferase family protein [Candidatus Kariarchaeaceae archaeon]|jgi:protein-S-isoprenylcysteine O-methyltransferase Ste14
MSSYHEHLAGKEHPNSHLLQAISPILFFIIWVLDTFIFELSTNLNSIIPFEVRLIVFLTILVLAIVLVRKTGKILLESSEVDTLINTGILNRVRHPLYLGTILFYFAFIALSLSLFSMLIWVIIAVIYNLLANYEEHDLERIFGDEYRNYKNNTPKWIPRIRSKY